MTFEEWLTVAREAMNVMTFYIEAGFDKPAEVPQADWERAARVFTVVNNRLSAGDDPLAVEAIKLFRQAPREHRPSMLVMLANKARNEPHFGAMLMQAF